MPAQVPAPDAAARHTGAGKNTLIWNATMTKPIKVGHLKANRLTVYKEQAGCGTFFWNDRRSRKEVRGNRLWTTLEGVQMRGSRPDARQLPLESQDEDEDEDGDIVVQMSGLGLGASDSEEEEQLQRAIARSLADASNQQHHGGHSAALPEELLCPILLTVMVDPVSTAEGQCYERAAIER
ncbi:hypothetical protein EMIHUDRAFT_243980 [Emiliania huxleyi CCMP1516]|uniref:U-box domain-containing protein n=2 Tax=Emiliania huxleyi TaxID=2903 RepID=A0A0D3J246_EMIH1|nr:hypothetical protein EMIHUDRAFT_243980 [Emiliania huxleyi CCMP1516]EOD17581.1 hypothetical protein EMIHUDRAFT_243980 [Emiliania huxleyi CCMP1516]|eukprot:XP_005770010.1 hypothetical protein EMIHUDRAFT_243980 [Emiliania huxleyi CCMP1516]